MDPLDLTKKPPRGPRETVNGIVMMARTIDKVRGGLPGGNSGEYRLPGFSKTLLDELGIDEEVFRKVVADAKSDDDVARWLSENTDRSRYEDINRDWLQESVEGYSDKFFERYPVARKYNLTNAFDVLDYDDRESFGVAHPARSSP